MADLPYSFEPTPGYNAYKVSSQLRDYLQLLMEHPENKDSIDQILNLISSYTTQLKQLRIKNQSETTRQVYNAIDGFFNAAGDENKKDITCKEGCTFCCHIEIDVSADEAATIVDHCRENSIEIDRDYLTQQAAVGRKTFSALSKCVFLKDNLCSIYSVRPVACRKHWVKTDPVLCDFSKNIVNPVGGYFDINAEILASAILNVDETGPLEKVLLSEMDKSQAS